MAAWTCPQCKRLVPERMTACRCGAEREAEEVARRGFPTSALWVVAIIAAAGWAGYSIARPPQKMAPLKLRKQEPSQVMVVEVPADRGHFESRPAAVEPRPEGSLVGATPTPARVEPQLSGRPRSDEDKARAVAEAVYRPRMLSVAAQVNQSRVMTRRYVDACLSHTVTRLSGSSQRTTVTSGVSVSSAEGSATYTDADGDVIGRSTGQATGRGSWQEVAGQTNSWAEVQALDNSTTPECRALRSDIESVRDEVDRVMADADQEAVRQNVWTWLQTDVPRSLAEQLWR